MKINELMVGDWMSINGLNLKVGAIHADEIGVFDPDHKIYWCSDDGLDRIDPIPLSEKILVKNGFEKFAESQTHFDYTDNDIHLEYWIGDGCFRYYTAEINYVHQLQHLLRLADIEKDIEL